MTYFRNLFRLSARAEEDAVRAAKLLEGATSNWHPVHVFQNFKGAEAFVADRWNTTLSAARNILGYSGFTSVGGTSYESHSKTIFKLGYDADANATAPVDTTPASTLHRRDNYDYHNQAIADQDDPSELPQSYYLTAKPYWFGTLPWPAIDPTNPAAATGKSNPAGYLHITGERPPQPRRLLSNRPTKPSLPVTEPPSSSASTVSQLPRCAGRLAPITGPPGTISRTASNIQAPPAIR